MNHALQDAVSLDHDSPSLLRSYAEWEQLLLRPLSELGALLTAETDEDGSIGESSPFHYS